jgi:hypothetical protein
MHVPDLGSQFEGWPDTTKTIPRVDSSTDDVPRRREVRRGGLQWRCKFGRLLDMESKGTNSMV